MVRRTLPATEACAAANDTAAAVTSERVAFESDDTTPGTGHELHGAVVNRTSTRFEEIHQRETTRTVTAANQK